MKMLLLFAFQLLAFITEAQKLDIFTGIGVNHYFNKDYSKEHLASYPQGLAKCLGLGYFHKTGLGLDMGLTLKYMEIQGGINIENNALGAGYALDINTRINTLELGIFPVSFRTADSRVELQLGIEFAYLIGGKVKGEQTNWHLDLDTSVYPPKTITVNESKPIDSHSDAYFTDLAAALCMKIGYAFNLGQKLELVPRLQFGYGLGKRFTDEVDSTPKNRVVMLELAARSRL